MSTLMSTAARLVTVAEILANLPAHIPHPYITAGDWGTEISWHLTLNTKDEAQQKRLAADIVRHHAGPWAKDARGDQFVFENKDTLPGIKLRVTVAREAVCERVVTGTERFTVPAMEAVPERTEIREIVEWRCEPLLAEGVDA